jgi:excisionase family DNA binding protein
MSEREQLLTVEEVTEWLNVARSWVRSHASGHRAPLLPSIKIGRFRRFSRAAVERWIQELIEKMEDA